LRGVYFAHFYITLFRIAMKIAVLADIHGNLPALEAVIADIEQWRPDQVVIAGDVVNRGPRPLECLNLAMQMVRQNGWLILQGNHEEYVINQANLNLEKTPGEREISRNAQWTYGRLNRDVSPLQAMPRQIELTGPDDRPLRFVHASMISNRDGIYPNNKLGELRRLIAPAPAVLCAGHTHRPVIHKVDDSLAINVGSVGMPFDDDRRASYARLTWTDGRWRPKIIRLRYDWDQTEQDFFQTGFLPDAGDLARIMLVEFQQARPLLNIWTRRYYDAVIAGNIAIANSVAQFSREMGLPDLLADTFKPAAKPVEWSPVAWAVAAD
jgi:putative phosphoesterase